MAKLPHVTVLFWVMKIAAVTLGETGGDLLAQTLRIGYAVSSLLFIGLFIASLVTQLKARAFHPALYWTVIVSTSTAGTTISDLMNRSAGLGYARGALVLVTCLGGIFAIWGLSGQTFSVERIGTFSGELLYWFAILCSNTVGTSLGDFLADTSGLGFAGSALVISGAMALIIIAYYRTRISSTLLFWTAFVLTRPWGATVGDLLTKPHSKGGLNLGTAGSSATLTAILLLLIGFSLVRQRRGAEGEAVMARSR